MNDMNNALESFSTAKSKATAALGNWVREFFPYLILILNVVVTVVSRLFIVELVNPFSADFFITLGNNLLSTTFCYACFTTYGERYTQGTLSAYSANKKTWGEISARVRKRIDEFVEYCREESKKEREERQRAMICNNTLLDYAEYREKYCRLTRREIRKLVREGSLSRYTARFVIKANNIRVKPIKPLLILCGVQIDHLNEAGRDGIKHSTLSVISRPAIVFVTSTMISMISGKWFGISDPSVIYDMIILALLIIISSVLGFSAGAESAKREHDKIKARIFFLEKYEQQ